MRIYEMTATFGKLEHQKLKLRPGLNIITAPNEWGKSTWCAFLAAMFYGLDTRAKSTKAGLADKDRYAPWSGLPMEGRIDLNWQGRDITIERKTKRRIPMGDFSAYETRTGLPVPELTAANCGQLLLGVERSVFLRSGFIRHSDLPVTQDEALRRRLNALVTTGDENSDADRLADALKELRNKCRYNRSGLLPQAQAERDALESRLTELSTLDDQCRQLKVQLEDVKTHISQLINHRQAMEYASSQSNRAQADRARESLDAALAQLHTEQSRCRELPSREEAQQLSAELRVLQQDWSSLQRDLQTAPEEPAAPPVPAMFAGMRIDEARKMVTGDAQNYVFSQRSGIFLLLIVMGLLGLTASAVLLFLKSYLFAGITALFSTAALTWGIYETVTMKRRRTFLIKKYGSSDHSRWYLPLVAYEKEQKQYFARLKAYNEASRDIQSRLTQIQDRMEALCGSDSLDVTAEKCSQVLAAWNDYEAAQREADRARSHYEALLNLVRVTQQPEGPDALSYSESETARLLAEHSAQQQRLQNLLGQYQGRMDSLGDRRTLENRLEQKIRRIEKLENTYAALVIAQDTLSSARDELQRRFAPRITHRAQELMQTMTKGRYSQITMDAEFSLRALTREEDTLRDSVWRSDGTVDQLYLALRLAVAEELTPEAPLILDDVLVRFDDQRMRAAVDILEDMALKKQVILFSCQGREIIS